MIDADVFVTVWTRLEQRFGKQEGASAYASYLNAQGLATDEFVAAAEALWATSRFFPRPADFLLARSGTSWKATVKAAQKRRPGTMVEFEAMRHSIGERGWAALESLGGLDVVRNAKDLLHVRREFLAAYEAQVRDDSAAAALLPAPPESRKALVRRK